MRETYSYASAYGSPSFKQPQYHPGNHISIQYPTSSHPCPSYLLTPAYVSASLSESNYTDYLAANEYEIEDNSDVQSNSYYTSETRSHQGGSSMPYIDSTITGGMHNNYPAGNGHNLAIAGHDVAFTEFDTPYYGRNYDTSPEKIQRTEFSSNGYSSMGSHFQPHETQSFELDLFTDPLFRHDSSTDVHHSLNSIAAIQMSSEYHLLPLNPNFTVDRCARPAVLAPRNYVKSPYCSASVPVSHTDQAVRPTNVTTWTPSGINRFATGPIIASNTSPSVTSVETNQLDRPSNSSDPCYITSSRGTTTHTSLVAPVASPGYTGNGTSSSFIPVTQVSSSISTLPPISQEAAPSLGSLKIIKPNHPQKIDDNGHDKSINAVPLRISSAKSSASITRTDPEHGISKCQWKGCSTTTQKKHHKSNMRNHVRTKHEKPAPPMCEICGVKFEKNESLKRHLTKRIHNFPLEESVTTVRKKRANGTPYTTYQQVHDYVKGKTMEKA